MNSQPSKIAVFYCSNCLEPEEITGFFGKQTGITVNPIGMPCSGKIDVPYLMKAFETGADGAVIITCKQNECQHLEGNLRAGKRAEAVDHLLGEIGMGKGRITAVMVKEGGAPQVLREVQSFINKICRLPDLQNSTLHT